MIDVVGTSHTGEPAIDVANNIDAAMVRCADNGRDRCGDRYDENEQWHVAVALAQDGNRIVVMIVDGAVEQHEIEAVADAYVEELKRWRTSSSERT